MQPFVCPRCGYESTFDPRVAAARCPRCGYTPSSTGPPPPTRPFFGESDRRLDWGAGQVPSQSEAGQDRADREGMAAAPVAWLYTCPRCDHETLILQGASFRCQHCGHWRRKGEEPPQGIPWDDLREFLGVSDEPPRWPDLPLRVGEGEQARRLGELFAERVPLQVFACPSCGRQSVFRADESPYCAWCGDAAHRRTRPPTPPPPRRAGPLPVAPRSGRSRPRLAWGGIRAALSFLFLLTWGLLLLFALARDLEESAGHKLQLLFSATETVSGTVERRYYTTDSHGAPANYYVVYTYSAPGAEGQPTLFRSTERVKWGLYRQLEPGSPVTVRYARRDPNIASLQGNQGFCLGTTCLTLFVLLVVILALYVWATHRGADGSDSAA